MHNITFGYTIVLLLQPGSGGIAGYKIFVCLPSRRPQPTSYILLHEAYRQDGSTWRKTADSATAAQLPSQLCDRWLHCVGP